MTTTASPSTLPLIYATGFTPAGVPLVGGVWKLWEQEGFPIESSHLLCQQNGGAVDWCEAMADASQTNNLPVLMKQLEAFLPAVAVASLQAAFLRLVQSGGATFEQIVAEKRRLGRPFTVFISGKPSS